MGDSPLTIALVAFQAELPHIEKGNTANVPTKSGGNFKYDYADLTDVSKVILPLLATHGLAWTAMPTMTEHGFALRYQLLHTSGEVLEGFYPLPQVAPQEIGSAITYARRYALCAVTGVAPGGDDDDAGKAQAAPANKPNDAERVVKAMAALSACTTPQLLETAWTRVKAGGLDTVPTLISTYKRMKELHAEETLEGSS